MARWLWLFWTYSFLGFLLEKGFAVATRSTRRRRRCFLLLPLCPVYGLGALAVLALPPSATDTFWGLALWGGLAATAVEYAVHLLYERLLGVQFWDYSGVWGNLQGRVCVPFSVIWGLLLAVGLPPLQRWMVPLLDAIPAALTYAMLLLFTADALLSARVLYQTGEAESVRYPLWQWKKPPA
ncbi:putative ABC transporter permease [Oscillibacter sp.]|uniref:putative ABC transporter permease n=1 Tax=Oscillibacter sp. TaxID=1945593 RepID=UPI0026301B6A|nr:putative ABC transporter permease [Oscillibacter sp.]MDD3346800.1 putative ABC transporter permease [Oscillibacter sp.]